MAGKKGMRHKKKDLDYMPGCELCEVGLVNRIDQIKESESVSANMACKIIMEEITDRYGSALYSQNALQRRYSKLKGTSKKDINDDNKQSGWTSGPRKTAQASDIIEENNSENDSLDSDDSDFKTNRSNIDEADIRAKIEIVKKKRLAKEQAIREERKVERKAEKEAEKETERLKEKKEQERLAQARKAMENDGIMEIDAAWKVFGIENIIPVRSSITKESLKILYRGLALRKHPDQGGTNEELRELNIAHNTLKLNSVDVTIIKWR